MAKPKLHELLAVEDDARGVATKVQDEAKITFVKRPEHFMASHRVYSPFEETTEDLSAHEQTLELTTTVAEKLAYVETQLAKYWDVVYKKESANQEAKADIVIGDQVIASDVPAGFLLGLEKKLGEYRRVCETIPTLQPGIRWEPDPDKGANIYRREPAEKTFKTEKFPNFRVLYDATKEHPAQIEKWTDNKNVGVYVKNVWSGMITVSDKSDLLDRIDNLIKAVKQARRRANGVEVSAGRIAKQLFDYIHAE